MDKKTLMAVLLILVVFWISSEFIWKKQRPATTQQPVTENVVETPVSSQPEVQSVTEIPIETQTDVDIRDDIFLENDVLKITFTNLGGEITSIQLKEYFLSDKIALVELIPDNESIFKIELQMNTGDVMNLGNVAFQHEIYEESNRARFFAQTEKGVIEKTFTLSDNYQLDFTLKTNGYENLKSYDLGIDSGIADTEEYLKMKNREYKIVGQLDNTITKLTLSKLKESRELSGNLDWAAVKSKYFAIAVIPGDLIEVSRLLAFKQNESPAMNLEITTSRADFSHNFQLYFGPLIYENLKMYGNGIESTVEIGPKFLQWISKIFMAFLKILNSIIPSWGICVLIFAIILKVLLYPLTHKSFESSTKMQKIQPLMKGIQAKYKHDPQLMNTELKKLYKEHGVNPLGGCLPMLLQMPILFALYPILRYSIDLRQAGFLWLPDLSEPDPIWLLPILMAVFMFVQQKLMAPSKQTLENMDEKQRATQQSQKMMMYFMPIMMFFIFKSLSSGLVLYWTVFSIIGTIQQYFIKKKFSRV